MTCGSSCPTADGPGAGADPIELFPAWETLPFERVSPATETMGRRLRVLWRLRCGLEDPSVLPAVIIAPVRALAQRLGPHVEDVVPITVKPGQVVDRDELVARLVAAGYRREYQVEARGEFAVRGSILDVYPSTADHPVRIDLWGDEVDRLQTFSVADQRATGDCRRGGARSSPAGSCCPPRRSGPGPRSSSAPSRGAGPSGSGCPRGCSSTGWSRGCRG